ncbi:hypothetical protein DQ04_01261010 [Trypanosoma grayi]|uniref:hypothetical protein n=1 Tax=Trypanosoma grayi TaxID=71804 RepID=UPI0004F43270|nr:hypothetical protein DQ04_01261010 [Trypanosoma grayi]KEG13020.1 hypothetical protein DQ04_01261010 [Trypanosoma grayi]
MTLVDGYISIVVLSVGVFLCGKGEERGLDKVVEAFIGDRLQSPNAVYRGKVMKYFVQLAPAQATLIIPLDAVYIVPYELAAYMFDEMLPAIKHVADIDVRSCVRYLETLQAGTEAFPNDKARIALGTRGTTAAAAAEGGGGGGMTATGGLQMYSAEMVVRDYEEPFISETAHILQALTVCLENLPSEVLDPDMDSDCAVTFFIFKNCVTHMRSVFQTQRPNTLWEPYTLKIVTRFLDALAMIGRNPQYTERVVALFSEMQVECTELQWSSLIGQAQECAGVNGGVGSLLSMEVGGASTVLKKPSGGNVSRHRQFTPEYLLAKQQAYVASVFVLLRQIATHPPLRDQVRNYVTLSLALEFLYAPRLSQVVLGKVLSLIGSLITNHEEAERVWTFIEENHLLHPTTDAAAVAQGQPSRRVDSSRRGSASENSDETAVTVEARSLLGHCQYECHHATYSITIGFLDLMIAMFKHHVAEMAHVPTYTMVIRFIAEEIFRGVLRRFFSSVHERYTVAALAAAALNRALSLRLMLTANTSMVPFTVVMACSKAPADVLGEALQIISEASGAPNELLNYQRAAVRQCLALLKTAIVVKREQGLDSLFTFDARTASNTELAVHLLPLSATVDSLLAKKALQLLLLLPQPTVSQAARHWFSRPDAQEAVITPFVAALRVEAVNGPIIHVPPALADLDHDEMQFFLPHAEVETKSLIMDLLIQHARAPQTSITSWLCGYPLYGSSAELLPGYCLEPVIAGANNREVEETHPHIAVKYVKLLCLLRANPSLSTPSLHRLMKRRGNDEMFYVLQTLRPDQCSSQIMSKYAYVMKLLALDVFSIGTNTVGELDGPSPVLSNSSLIELLFILLRAAPEMIFGVDEYAPQSQLDNNNNNNSASVAADFAQWPSLCLKSLPMFPTNCMAPGGAESYVFCSFDETPQYSIPLIYEALQKESLMSNKRTLTVVELKERLSVFVKANECLAAYAGGVRFIDGWCSLANISVTVHNGISYERILYMAQSLLESVQLTSSLTVAAQEQIVYQLSQTLATLMAQLKRKMSLNSGNSKISGEGSKNLADARRPPDSTGVIAHGGDETKINGSVVVPWHSRPESIDIPQASAISQAARMSVMDATGRTRRSGKRDFTGTLVVSKQDAVGMVGRSLIASETLQLLKSLLVTTVQWGSRVPLARQHFYNAILTFLGIPGVSVDDITLQRYHSALFSALVQDTATTSPSCNKLPALALITQLLHLSPQLCEMLCVPLSGDGASSNLMACITNAFQAIDESISTFFGHGCADASSILWLLQVVFDLLMIVSQQHAVQLLQINALSRCMAMKVWKTSARVALGHADNITDNVVYGSDSIEVYKKVIKNVLLSTIRWFNAVLSALDNSEVALMPIAEFVRANQLLFQNVLSSPLSGSHMRHIDSLTLELFGEIGGLLLRLACSPLVDECRTLVHLFALPDLLAVLTKIDFIESPTFVAESVTASMAASVSTSISQTASLPSARQRQQIAIALQNMLQFLVRVENLVPLYAAGGERAAADVEGQSPRLSNDARSRMLIFKVTEQLVSIMESFYNNQVIQVACFVPHLIALHCLVLLLHAFLLSDRVSYAKNMHSQWAAIVHALEGAQRVVNMWKAFHSDYMKGLKLNRAGGRWSVTAPSVSNQSVYPAIRGPPQDKSHRTVAYSHVSVDTSVVNPAASARIDASGRGGLHHGSHIDVDQSFTNRLSTVSVAADAVRQVRMGGVATSMMGEDTTALPPVIVGGDSIGALVEVSRRDDVSLEEEDWPVHPVWDEVLGMESLLRQVKVAISNALRVASHT